MLETLTNDELWRFYIADPTPKTTLEEELFRRFESLLNETDHLRWLTEHYGLDT